MKVSVYKTIKFKNQKRRIIMILLKQYWSEIFKNAWIKGTI